MRAHLVLASVVVLAVGSVAGAGAAEVIDLGPLSTGIELVVDGAEVLHVQVSEVRLDRIAIEGADWAVVQVPGGHNSMDRGLPSLPSLTGEYLLERTGAIRLELVDARVRELDLGSYGFSGVAPSKGHFDRGTDPATVPWVFDPKVYGGAASYPAETAVVDRPAIAGPLRAQALRLPTAHWRPDTNVLTVVEEAWFRVVRLTEGDNPRIGPDRPLTGLFDAVARLHAVNYDQARSRYVPFVETGRLLILAYDDFVDEAAPLADWESLVGYPTLLTPVSAAGTTGAQIKSYIQSLYDAPEGLSWIILVGDAQQIPSLSGVNEGATCDPCYTKLEGADNRPDAAISRISAQTGAQVTVQVDKILDYEQLPDSGSAAAWYGKAFGVAGDDTGGTPSYADWQRMDFLRDDLLAPAYTYTEFDQLYHYPTKAAVAGSINAGRSLGLYIGHGSETSWSTSGFSVSDINSMLTNDETQPVIWSVACVNGRFDRTGGDCFGEAWLKKDGGGAVSFEGATTNESWVPPCDAQRGFIDALRLETAFTTGGQHVNGKLYCMDVNGDSNSSEGTRFMEQSTLFGAATMWPRTAEALTPDEPVDYNLAGGVATLTVKVGGAPFAAASGAIVSFYEDTGGVNVLGSGLVDAGGVVTAVMSGDPTHCHIHGRNLIPTSYELGAREAGRVSLDAAAYACASLVTVRVADSNIPGSSPATIDTTTAELAAGGGPTLVTLTETGPDRDIYVGAAQLGVNLAVAHGDTLVATYIDADDGAGGVNVPRTATATVDCLGPAISSVAATATEAAVTFGFATDEPGTTEIVWGTSAPPANVVSDAALTTAHEVIVDGLTPCTTLYYEVRSADAQGNLTIDDNGGAFYTVDTAGWGTFLEESFDTDPGWTIDNGGFPTTGWAFGQPTGQGQDIYGGPDPLAGYSGPYAYGVNLDGDAPANAGNNEIKLTTPVIDLSEATSARLRFRRWLGVEQDAYDHARILLSLDGGASWQTAWENGSSTIDDQAWIEQVVDLPQAVGQSQVRIRWTYGSSDSIWNYCGWNIDDVVVEGARPCTNMNPLFLDGFETGDCSRWDMVVGEN
ncbi:MAG: C25 family cysteine peptidase [Thermoanaerobaculales bacterium]|nr:C25 family cysteine peptidase [Thermoanaerobaculales bacterium]